MKFINVDALKHNLFDYAAPEMVWNKGDIEHKIKEMPIIDAVPIEWLREKMNFAEGVGDFDSVDLFSWIIKTWYYEQEEEQC